MSYTRGETVICSVTVKNSSGTLVDPTTSMKITITHQNSTVEVNEQAMTKDSTGTYHYDWATTSATTRGPYIIKYIATDGSRVSIGRVTEEVV